MDTANVAVRRQSSGVSTGRWLSIARCGVRRQRQRRGVHTPKKAAAMFHVEQHQALPTPVQSNLGGKETQDSAAGRAHPWASPAPNTSAPNDTRRRDASIHHSRIVQARISPRRVPAYGGVFPDYSRMGITTYRVVSVPGAWIRQLLLESVRPSSTRSLSMALRASRR